MRQIGVLLVATAAFALLPTCGPLCRSRGGHYIHAHFGTRRICVMPAKDTGKTCRNNRDCEKSYCRCPDNLENRLRQFFKDKRIFSNKLAPIPTTGKCQRFGFRGGFRCIVRRGYAESDFILID